MNTRKYVDRLAAAGILSPEAEVKVILGHVLERPCPDLPGTLNDLPEAAKALFVDMIEKRAARISSVRVCGQTSFAGAVIGIEDGVFAPYPESESVVDHAVLLMEKQERPLRILDLGTGSGCLLISLLLNLPHATGVGVDINEKALALAQKNAARNGVQDRAKFLSNDWANGIEERFDLVVSNPPRVMTGHISLCLPEVKNHDPMDSLDGGEDGLKFYRMLAKDFGRIAEEGGYGFFQTGPHAKDVQGLFNKAGFFDTVIKLDYRHSPLGLVVRNRKAKKSSFGTILRRFWPRED